ncbi:hypothetical protein [Chitinophaga rhizosphaerae]|uniref:hypothetical protein n=1 Tax=Chitinophaga rhizosphaerae TaxID=1864947 RepID=UPI0013DF0EF6|nr:hypothetical protein [Chitinophaga rhizosphaerae]
MERLTDLRFIIGLFFLLTGLLLAGYSFFRAKAGINLWYGLLIMGFGRLMALFSPKPK